MNGQLIPEIGRDFLLAELNTGITFATLGLSAPDSDNLKIERWTKNARHAYDTFLRFRARVTLTDAENTELRETSDKLKRALQQLGERIA